MAKPTTERFEEMVLAVDFDEDGTFSKICGIKGVNITRTGNAAETEVLDCEDESQPNEILTDVQSIKVMASGDGTWAAESNGKMMSWFYSGKHKPVRLSNTAAASGDVETESGPANLVQLNQARSDGKGRVTASIEIVFSGIPELTVKA
ncbi:Phage major tail protein 2 [Pseudovibrio axinellae]|uniref:Phage major tail protein 2 n=1 Tax=Pseudovibrio axinellae TaxID=989403 RepID=A0A165SVW4_9HYPH|nr:phage tail tube protein [Pseudovibrio axinellae]KZL04542.1 Phage major tail protein 2 [Pseudovibrio axinellae]SEQ73752.1 Phage tail tube protein [Pseudovibrio axinellae]